MASPSFYGWWMVLANGTPVALIKEVNVLRKVEKLWRDAGCKVRSEQCETRQDVRRLQLGEAVLDALGKEGLAVIRPLGRSAEKESTEP